jgi:hypothetical protein
LRAIEDHGSLPQDVACAWIGNSQLIARKHYPQVTDEHLRLATTAPETTAAGAVALQMTPQQSRETSCNPMQDQSSPVDETLDVASGCIESRTLTCQEPPEGMGVTGLEPVTSTV